MKKISVIVPVYNVEKYVRKCIESILTQSYKNIEVILVDDGSTDSSGAICDEYAEKDKRIIIIHKENGGLSSARNAGLDIATGDYIAFIDSDDYIEMDMIELLYTNITENNAELAICNMRYVDENGNSLDEMNRKSPLLNKLCSKEDIFESLCKPFNWYYVVACNKLYKKELFNEIRFPIGKIHEDEFVIHQLIDKCNKIIMSEKMSYNYVQRSNSIMGNGVSVRTLNRVQARIERSCFFYKNGLADLGEKTLRAALSDICFIDFNIDLHSVEAKQEIKKIKKIYNELYFDIMKSEISFAKKTMYTLFFLNINIYLKCIKFYRKLRWKLKDKL